MSTLYPITQEQADQLIEMGKPRPRRQTSQADLKAIYQKFQALTKPVIIAAGSADGILTSAAVLRLLSLSPKNVSVLFTQAFAVAELPGDRPSKYLDLDFLMPGSQIILVDLAVDNTATPFSDADPTPRGLARTRTFVNRLYERGHTIVAIIDEHGRDLWVQACNQVPVPDTLLVAPEGHGQGRDPKWPSSGYVLDRALFQDGLPFGMASHKGEPTSQALDISALLCAANNADQGVFNDIGQIVNDAVKGAITDDARRVYLARHFAQHMQADETIQDWIDEYKAMTAHHDKVLSEGEMHGQVLVLHTNGKRVDATTLLFEAYKRAKYVGLADGDRCYLGGGARGADIEIRAILTAAQIPCSGSGRLAIDAYNFGLAVQALA